MSIEQTNFGNRGKDMVAMVIPTSLVRGENFAECYGESDLQCIITDYESYLYYRCARKSVRDGGVGDRWTNQCKEHRYEH